MERVVASQSRFEFRTIVCPTCEVDDTRPLGKRGGASHRDGAGEECEIVQCKRCRLIYANPFLFPIDLDALYSTSEDYFGAHGDQAVKIAHREGLVRQLEKKTAGRRLLDVGAGLGETVAAATRLGWDAYGIDSASEFVKRAETLVPGRVFHGEIQRPPPEIAARQFDAVVLGAVLEHLHEPKDVILAIAKLLAPGGVLYIDVPNEIGLYFKAGNLWMRLRGRDWVVNLAPTFAPLHVFGWSRPALSAMLRRCGLEPEHWGFYSGATLLPFRRSVSGAIEWLGSRTMATIGSRGEMGAYLECFARKSSS